MFLTHEKWYALVKFHVLTWFFIGKKFYVYDSAFYSPSFLTMVDLLKYLFFMCFYNSIKQPCRIFVFFYWVLLHFVLFASFERFIKINCKSLIKIIKIALKLVTKWVSKLKWKLSNMYNQQLKIDAHFERKTLHCLFILKAQVFQTKALNLYVIGYCLHHDY